MPEMLLSYQTSLFLSFSTSMAAACRRHRCNQTSPQANRKVLPPRPQRKKEKKTGGKRININSSCTRHESKTKALKFGVARITCVPNYFAHLFLFTLGPTSRSAKLDRRKILLIIISCPSYIPVHSFFSDVVHDKLNNRYLIAS